MKTKQKPSMMFREKPNMSTGFFHDEKGDTYILQMTWDETKECLTDIQFRKGNQELYIPCRTSRGKKGLTDLIKVGRAERFIAFLSNRIELYSWKNNVPFSDTESITKFLKHNFLAS